MSGLDYEMEYRAYVQWCEANRLPSMDYIQWECGYFMRGMDERRDQKNRRTDGDTEVKQKGVNQNAAQDIDICTAQREAK